MTPDTHKFALELGLVLKEPEQLALEGMMLKDWIRLIDVSCIGSTGASADARVYGATGGGGTL